MGALTRPSRSRSDAARSTGCASSTSPAASEPRATCVARSSSRRTGLAVAASARMSAVVLTTASGRRGRRWSTSSRAAPGAASCSCPPGQTPGTAQTAVVWQHTAPAPRPRPSSSPPWWEAARGSCGYARTILRTSGWSCRSSSRRTRTSTQRSARWRVDLRARSSADLHLERGRWCRCRWCTRGQATSHTAHALLPTIGAWIPSWAHGVPIRAVWSGPDHCGGVPTPMSVP